MNNAMSDEKELSQVSQAHCVDMANDAEDGHYWYWSVNTGQMPGEFRRCFHCGRIDASEWVTDRDQQIALAAQSDLKRKIAEFTEETYYCTYEAEPNSLRCKWCGSTRLSSEHNVSRLLQPLDLLPNKPQGDKEGE